jgi:hypothetical protein
MIRAGRVDTCHPMMVRSSVIYGVTRHPMTAADFRRIATEPGGDRRVLPLRIASSSCSRQEICSAGPVMIEVQQVRDSRISAHSRSISLRSHRVLGLTKFPTLRHCLCEAGG